MVVVRDVEGRRVEGRVWVVVEVRREVARGAEERTRRIMKMIRVFKLSIACAFGDGLLGYRLMVSGGGRFGCGVGMFEQSVDVCWQVALVEVM